MIILIRERRSAQNAHAVSWLRVALTWLALSGALASCSLPPAVVRAQKLLDSGQYAAAIQSADRDLHADPDLDELRRIKIRASFFSGDSSSAVATYIEWRQLREGRDDREALAELAKLTLWRGLTAPSAALNIAAIHAVANHQIAALADEVTALIAADDDRVSATAAIAVLRDHPQAASVAAARLRSPDPSARAIVISGINRKIPARSADDVRAALADPAASVRIAAIAAVMKLADRSDTAALAKMARSDMNKQVRARAGRALAQAPYVVDLELARALVLDDYLGAQLAGLTLALHHSGKGGREVLRQAARAKDLTVAIRAAVLLGPGPSWQDLFDNALRSPKWTLRAAALGAILQATNHSIAHRAAIAALLDHDLGVRLAAARLLVRLGNKEAAKTIFIAAVEGDNPELSAAHALVSKYHDDRGRVAIARGARSPIRETRARAIAMYRQLGINSDALIRALADKSGLIRLQAADIILALLK